MSYRVVVPLVLAQAQDGQTQHVYQGGIIPWLSDEQAEHFLSQDPPLVVEISEDDPAAEDGAKPPSNAAKPVLVAWVVAHALKDDGGEYTESEASDMNKADLWDVINSIEE